MSRSARLLALLQALRCRRRPVTAAALARELQVSERTIYRDLSELAAQGHSSQRVFGIQLLIEHDCPCRAFLRSCSFAVRPDRGNAKSLRQTAFNRSVSRSGDSSVAAQLLHGRSQKEICERRISRGQQESVVGQTRKSGRATRKSASPSGTDMLCRACQVRKVPIAHGIRLIILLAARHHAADKQKREDGRA